MGVLGRGLVAVLVATLASCYAPSLRDCTVSCESNGECAGDQVCGADGLCAAPAVAGQCGVIGADPGIDGGLPDDAGLARDAQLADAGVPTVSLRVQVTGKGSIVVTGVGTCSSETAQKGDCTYTVPSGVARTVRAVAVRPNEVFARWISLVCGGQAATCTFTPFLPTVVGARFDHQDIP